MRELVALALPGGAGFVDALRRAWDDGDAVLPVDLRLPAPARAALLDALRPRRVVSTDGTVSLPDAVPVLDGDALVMATSGTTGAPKGVVLTYDAIRASAEATTSYLGIDPDRHHWLACLPLAHIGGLSVICRALVSGTGLTVLPGFDADAVIACATAPGGPTHVSLVPTALSRLDPAIFERIVLGGSAPPEGLPGNVVTTYGLTETGSGVVYDGWTLDGVEVREVDGELLLRGPMLLRAYRRAGDGPAGFDPRDGAGWFATNDGGGVVEREGRPFVQVFGRRGDVIVTGSQKVWPDPVERVLQAAPGVAEVAVVGRPDPEWGAVVTAVIVPADPASPPTLDALRDAVKAKLAAYCAPRQVELVATLPRTALGKIQRNRL